MNKPVSILVLLFILVYMLPLGARLFIIPDETRYAEIPREMLASGDWTSPRLAGVRYFEKPVLGYWMNAASMGIFGDNRFAARFPSVLSVGLTALVLFLFTRRFRRGGLAGPLAAAAFLTCPMVFAFGVFNILDNALALYLTAGMAAFFCAYSADTRRSRLAFLALFGVSCAAAFLTKGFLAFAVPVVSIIPFVMWERRWRDLLTLPWLPILVAGAVAAPWAIAIHRHEPTYWHYFFWVEHIRRFMSDGAQHPEPFHFFIPHIAWGMLPWLALIPAAVMGFKKDDLKAAPVRFALCWFLFPFLFFSMSEGKIATYILPCFPPLIFLVGVGLAGYIESGRKKLIKLGASILAVLAGGASVVLILSQFADFVGFRIYAEQEAYKILILGGGIFLWAVILFSSLWAKSIRLAIALFCVAPVPIMFGTHFMFPIEFEGKKMPGRFLESHGDRITPNTIIISEGELAVAACYYYKRDDVYLYRGKGELAWGLGYEDAAERFLGDEDLRELFDTYRGASRIVLIVRRGHYEEYRNKFPPPVYEDTFGRFTFVEF